MPTVPDGIPATVTMVDHGVDLISAEEHGQPCLELSIADLARGDRTEMRSYSCMDSRDRLVTSLLIKDGSQLAVGGAVASDQDGRVLSSEEHSKALITSPRIPSQTSPPPRP